METVAILGSGFGLYGYLPAIARLSDCRFALPQRYLPTYSSRPELSALHDRIEWHVDERSALENAQSAVLALCPERQAHWLDACLSIDSLASLVLEKPLARTPQEADLLQQRLLSSGKNFRIGYVFCHLPWFKSLHQAVLAEGSRDSLSIDWRFQAHHFQRDVQTWKREHAVGGGALRFYGIHLVAVLAALGYSHVRYSQLLMNDRSEVEAWQATFSAPGLVECNITLNSRSEQSCFAVRHSRYATLFSEDNPFVTPPLLAEATWRSDRSPEAVNGPGRIDQRVAVLGEIWKSLRENPRPPWALYESVLKLWQDVEQVAMWKTLSRAA